MIGVFQCWRLYSLFSAAQEVEVNREFTATGYKAGLISAHVIFIIKTCTGFPPLRRRELHTGATGGKKSKVQTLSKSVRRQTECRFSPTWNPRPSPQRVKADLVSVATLNV